MTCLKFRFFLLTHSAAKGESYDGACRTITRPFWRGIRDLAMQAKPVGAIAFAVLVIVILMAAFGGFGEF